MLASVTLALLGVGVWRIIDARQDADPRKRRAPAERVHIVNVATLTPATARPQLTAYGEIRSWRTLELRAPVAGRLVTVDPGARDGKAVSADKLLFVIDPADSEARQGDALAAFAEAETEEAESREAVLAAEQELEAARRQLELRRKSLVRQRSLLAKGYATRADIETAELALASADQTVLNREQMVITARKRVERSDLKVDRARITLSDAERQVGETRVSAPFGGLLTGVDGTLGRLVGVNEKLAELIDPGALEVVFRVSNRQFARLLDQNGQIAALPLQVELALGPRRVVVPGRLDRADAVVGAGQSGRLMFARLETSEATVLRPGDFVTIVIDEAPLERVAEVPSTAVTEDGRVLVLGPDDRLTEVKTEVARRQGKQILLANVPAGARYVTERLPQLGPGVRVKASESSSGVAVKQSEDDTILLDAARRDVLVKAITNAKRLPEERRAWLLDKLTAERVPRRLVERIEARIAARRAG